MLYVPRAVRLAAWGTAALRGQVSIPDAVAVTGDPDDEPHHLEGVGGLPAPAADLGELLQALGRAGAIGLRVVLPVAGDLFGLPGPPALNAAACDAGECVVTTGPSSSVTGGTAGVDSLAGSVALVPIATRFGPALDQGTLLTWQVHAANRRPELDHTDLAEADRSLREALAQTTSLLRDLDLARWRPEVAEQWADLAGTPLAPQALPPGTPERAAAVLATGLRLRAIIELALADDGAAVSGWEARRRAQTLRELDGVARRAVAAAGSGQRATDR